MNSEIYTIPFFLSIKYPNKHALWFWKIQSFFLPYHPTLLMQWKFLNLFNQQTLVNNRDYNGIL